jgi:hypothetical protein
LQQQAVGSGLEKPYLLCYAFLECKTFSLQGRKDKKVKRHDLCSSLYPWLYEKDWLLSIVLLLLRRKPGRDRNNGG